MPILKASASKSAKQARMRSEMEKFKRGELRSGSTDGPVVKSRSQAIAISLHESGQGRKTKRTHTRSQSRR
jgi:hypothetical protein